MIGRGESSIASRIQRGSIPGSDHRLRMEYRSAVLISKKQISSPSSFASRYELSTTAAASSSSIDPVNPPLSSGSTGPTSDNPGHTYPPDARSSTSEFGRGDADEVQTKTNEVTDALRRTLGTMQVELERSVLSVQMLGENGSPPRNGACTPASAVAILLSHT